MNTLTTGPIRFPMDVHRLSAKSLPIGLAIALPLVCFLALVACLEWMTSPRKAAAQAMDSARTPMSATGTLFTVTLTFSNTQRDVSIYLSSGYISGTATPLVFALHGGAGDASKMYDPSQRIVQYAESERFIAFFPNGVPRPNAPPTSTNFYWDAAVNQDYMAFLMDYAIANYTVDQSRVYFLGFSGGAKLIYELAGRPDISPRIAAIATMAGEIGGKSITRPEVPWEMVDPSISGGAPMPMLLLQGGNDVHMPSGGGLSDDKDAIKPSFQTKVDVMRLFVGVTTTQSITLPAAPARVVVTRHVNLATNHEVVAAFDPVLAHKWPDWNYMGAIWDFFQRMPTRTVTLASLPLTEHSLRGVPLHLRIPSKTESFTITPGVVQTITLEFSGTQRNVSFYVPTTYTGTQAPLLFVLHGAGQDASAMFEPSKGITLWAETKHFISVFPNGLSRPNAPPISTNYYWSPNDDPVNISYINFLMDTFMNQLAIDRHYVYVMGFSNGATFTYRLASDRATSARIAAIATVAGAIGVKSSRPITLPWIFADPALNQAWPVPALMLQGGLDATHSTEGGFDADHDSVNQAFQVKVDAWRAHLRATDGGASVNPPFAPGNVTATLYLSPTGGLGVLSIVDPQLGHAWPKLNDWNFIGSAWSFFEQMPKRTWPPPYQVHAPIVLR